MPAPKKPGKLPLAKTADDILSAEDLREEVVEIPEWGCSVKVRGFTLKVQQDIMNEATTADGVFDDDLHSALLLIHGIVEPQFTAEQAQALRGKSLAATNRVVGALNRCNGDGGQEDAERTFLAE